MSPELLHAEQHGSGTRVALVHGFTQTGDSWRPIGEALVAAGHEVVRVDAPGHGGSAAIHADIVVGAELLGSTCGQATYVGYSMGGRLCLQLALSSARLVERLVLLSTTAGIEDAADRDSRREADNALADEIEAAGDEGLESIIDRWLAGPLFEDLPAGAAQRQLRMTNTAAGLASSLRLAGTGAMTPLWDRLAELSMPVLVLAGERDQKFATIAERMTRAIGINARMEVIAHSTHAAHLHHPDSVGERIIAFLESTADTD